MRHVRVLLLAALAIGFLAPAIHAEEPCCAAVTFQTFNPKEVNIQLVAVKRTSPNDITVTWQIKNLTDKPVQFDRMQGLASYQLSSSASVLDIASRTKYGVAKEQKTQTPVAAKHDPPRASQGLGLREKATLETWAKFLVPANVTKVTVTLPGAAMPWENVAITQ
jgi:hypothetical protein